MKIVSIIGSPRKNGNCSRISQYICDEAAKNSHESETFYLYDQNIKGCTACKACKNEKVKLCVHNDDFIKIAEAIIEADCVILASPIYMSYITGVLKTFFDRWYTFSDKERKVRLIDNKKYVTILTYGAPNNYYPEIDTFMHNWGKHYFKMENAPAISAGSLMNEDDILKHEDIIEQAKEIGRTL